jgi:hypothetical protein
MVPRTPSKFLGKLDWTKRRLGVGVVLLDEGELLGGGCCGR